MENFTSYPPAVQERILNGPGMQPPAGIVPNIDNPASGNDACMAFLIICVVFAGTMGLLRLYSRVAISKKLQIEDYIGLLAFVPYAGGIWVFVSYMNTGGFMVHQWDIRLKDFLDLLHILLVLRIVYCLQMILAKTAILLEWTRIFIPRGTKGLFYWLTSSLITLNCLVYSSALVASVVSCVPIKKAWQPWVEGSCFNRKAADITTAWTNLLIDICILVLPQRIIWTLQMPRSRKIGVSVIFSVGLMVVACAIGRIHSNMVLDYKGDTAYDASINTIWAFAEMSGVLVVFCAPAAPQAFAHHGIFSGLVATLRSWTRMSTSSAQQSDNHSAGRLQSNSETYNCPSGSRDYKGVVIENDVVGGSDIVANATHNGIFKMTRMEQREEAASMTSTDPMLERQNPWTGRS